MKILRTRNSIKKISYIYLFFSFIAVSCSVLVKDPNLDLVFTGSTTPDPVGTATTLITFTSTPTMTVEPIWTSTSTMTAEPIGTSLPTLISQSPSLTVKKLLDNNGNCQLPCWWGIVPGKTTWQDTYAFLSPIATSFYEVTKKNSNPRYFEVFFPAPYPFKGEFRQEYFIEDDIVKWIEILPQNFSKYSLPKELIQEFGNPEMILLGGSVDQDQSFQLILYYPKLGIMAMYVTKWQPANYQEQVKICFTEIDYTDMFLWDPTDSFSETMDQKLKPYEHPFYDIKTVTTLTSVEFNKLFTSSDQPDCFFSPSSFWTK